MKILWGVKTNELIHRLLAARDTAGRNNCLLENRTRCEQENNAAQFHCWSAGLA